MKKIIYFAFLLFLTSCNYSDRGIEGTASESSDTENGNGQQGGQPGLITAGEWNDLDNWQFWKNLLNEERYANHGNRWNFYPNNRVSVLVKSNSQPVIDASVELFKNGATVWKAKTDNFGKAEMWIDLFQSNQSVEMSAYTLSIDGQAVSASLKPYSEGINEIELNTNRPSSNKVELSFIVDATGSMGDELEFLKADLASVIQRVKDNNSTLQISTSSVFYRDVEDEYVVRKSAFSNDLNTTLAFIDAQGASGGGDFPEAVHTALETGIGELQWSANAKARLAFLLLDAPPHHNTEVISSLQNAIKAAARKGIKLIPITASGINKETEFLMRFFAISTNSTYVFITNHSGIGNDHIEASVGEYQVEFLNDLMVRLIGKYTE